MWHSKTKHKQREKELIWSRILGRKKLKATGSTTTCSGVTKQDGDARASGQKNEGPHLLTTPVNGEPSCSTAMRDKQKNDLAVGSVAIQQRLTRLNKEIFKERTRFDND